MASNIYLFLPNATPSRSSLSLSFFAFTFTFMWKAFTVLYIILCNTFIFRALESNKPITNTALNTTKCVCVCVYSNHHERWSKKKNSEFESVGKDTDREKEKSLTKQE